ncbi:uncharacterized protein N0V89_009351 [Didymosphaeria variabile]|uniref:Uncharacterized protein n=1 Tax=Didymosphaeria variabile TaxID=1932322 RepID=A0A9W8XEY8_9PLEO|nr:uncharacterized protein N0V89_009351 [Didymosphaeria variabile]KAJ4347979.1 hypothetical protein N0V89_009351 [Didymosphaeria variabile]
MLKAEEFWRRHSLGNIVDEDDFVKGALIFHDLEGAREFEYKSSKHTEEEKRRYDEHQERLSGLSSRQKRSLRWYACRTEYTVEHHADAVVKQMIFAVGDAVVGVLVGKPNGPEDKLLWDHGKPNWKIMISISGVPALLFLTLIMFCVGESIRRSAQDPLLLTHRPAESPRWLLKKNRYKEALTALITLHQLPSPVIACGELYMIFRRLEAEESRYLEDLKRNHNPNDTRSTSETELSTELQSVSASALEGRQGIARRSFIQSQGDGAIDAQITSSGSTLQPRRDDSPRSFPTEEVQRTESFEATTLSRESAHSGVYVPVKLKDISLSTRIKLLWRVKHIRR